MPLPYAYGQGASRMHHAELGPDIDNYRRAVHYETSEYRLTVMTNGTTEAQTLVNILNGSRDVYIRPIP